MENDPCPKPGKEEEGGWTRKGPLGTSMDTETGGMLQRMGGDRGKCVGVLSREIPDCCGILL